MYAAAETRTSGCEKAAAALLFVTSVTFFDECVLPIRYRLQRMRPDRAGQYTLRKIINRNIHPGGNQVINSFRQPLAIVHGIHPEHRIVRNGKTGVFESHQRDVINERQIAGDPPARLRDNRRGQGMQDNADFNALAAILELENSKHGFVESTLGLHDIIVEMIDRGINW